VPIKIEPKSFISIGAKRMLAIDLQAELDTGVLLTGTPTITEGTAVLLLTGKKVSTTDLIINEESCVTGKAVQCLVDATNAVAGTVYTLSISVETDSSPAEILLYEHEVEAA
jgi:hypothetical protein